MHRRTLVATIFASLLILVASLPATGEESAYEAGTLQFPTEPAPSAPVIEPTESFKSDYPEAETFLAPTLDVTAEGVTSTIPATAWQADVELVAFHPEFGGIDFTENGEDVFYGSLRFTLGWESKSGFGVRGRLWGHEADTRSEFQTSDAFVSGGFPSGSGIDPDAVFVIIGPTTNYVLRNSSFDVDFYRRFAIDETSLVLGAGLKSAVVQLEIPSLTQNTAVGVGAGLFSDVRHVLYRTERSEFSLVGSGRVGFLTGEWRNKTIEVLVGANLFPPGGVPGGQLTNLPATSSSIVEEDADMVISEASLGFEWRRDWGWSVLSLRAQYESQLWNSDFTDDVSFNGGAVKAGLAW